MNQMKIFQFLYIKMKIKYEKYLIQNIQFLKIFLITEIIIDLLLTLKTEKKHSILIEYNEKNYIVGNEFKFKSQNYIHNIADNTAYKAIEDDISKIGDVINKNGKLKVNFYD